MFTYSEERKQEILRKLQKIAARENRYMRVYVKTLTSCPEGVSIEEVRFYYEDLDTALRAANLPPNKPTLEEAIKSLQEFYEDTGRQPVAMDASAGWLPYPLDTYRKLGGSWNRIMEMAGFTPKERWKSGGSPWRRWDSDRAGRLATMTHYK